MFDIWHEDPKYPSDLTDDQWQLIQPLIPPGPPGGRDRRTSMCAVVNAIFYINRGGCAWRMLPKDYPSWKLSTAISLVGSMMAPGKSFTTPCVAASAYGQVQGRALGGNR